MRLIDSNILIYSSQDQYAYLRSLVKGPDSYASYISYVEVLGYHQLTAKEEKYYKSIFSVLKLIPVSKAVILKATEIRQSKKYSVGDSIVAATALIYDLELNTRNIKDFKDIPDLRIHNPIR